MTTRNMLSLLVLLLVLSIQGHCSRSEELDKKILRRDTNEWTVTTIEVQPYLRVVVDERTGSKLFTGFIPDMMTIIGEKLKQKYRFHLVSDMKYGTYNESKKTWNGMIGEVIAQVADLAAAPLTVTDVRQQYVDFTKPFMTFGTVIILHKPPEGVTYHSLADLLDRPDIRFGAISEGATDKFIRTSTSPELIKIKERLEGVQTVDKGITRVRNSKDGKFGFIIEESSARFYMKQEPCDLMQIYVKQIGWRDYAFVVRKGYPMLDQINTAMREMNDSGEIHELRNKWWSGPCSNAGRRVILQPFISTLIAAAACLSYYWRI